MRFPTSGSTKPWFVIAVLVMVSVRAETALCAGNSAATEDCLSCHAGLHAGVVGDWKRSRHAQVSPAEALQKPERERRLSVDKVPEPLLNTTVGCAECHTANFEKHKDTFEHNGYQVHVVVSPVDCAGCHAVEADQYGHNLMSHAYGNLVDNVLYQDLERSINGVYGYREMKLEVAASDAETRADSCLSCHGTVVELKGMRQRETDMGTMDLPELSGWPNQGVGRVNPDGSTGSCTSCHARHEFAIEMARKPYTCSQCHSGPDVPAYKVYSVSKHGNIYSSTGKDWDFKAVPWKIGKDLNAPTCATCHASLLVDGEGAVIAERSHRMNDRLPWRMFGLIYAHPHPRSPDTTVIKNKAGIPLPTELTGEPVAEFLIDAKEQGVRANAMQLVCLGCHAEQWVKGHWARFENTIQTSNTATLTSTRLLLTAWEKGLARGPAQNDSIFNEAIERKWAEQWLFYGNAIRFSAAMVGADYGVFDQGRWFMSRNILDMQDWIERNRTSVDVAQKPVGESPMSEKGGLKPGSGTGKPK
jgi:hydroxylamine dehydrogenase